MYVHVGVQSGDSPTETEERSLVLRSSVGGTLLPDSGHYRQSLSCAATVPRHWWDIRAAFVVAKALKRGEKNSIAVQQYQCDGHRICISSPARHRLAGESRASQCLPNAYRHDNLLSADRVVLVLS